MILIFEGADGTGKTTASLKAAYERPAWYRHAGAPTAVSWRDEYVKPLKAFTDADLVLDRWHVGEAVWPEIFGRSSLYSSISDLMLCCTELAALSAKVIVVHRAPGAIAAELVSRGETDSIDTVLNAQDRFLDLASKISSWIPTQVIDSDELYRGTIDLWSLSD